MLMKKIRVDKLPGPRSKEYLDRNRETNLGWMPAYPFIPTNKGEGCYFEDLDRNVFLDFASHVATNPLGYNHPDIIRVINEHAKRAPIKFAGQDFLPKEHQDLLDELITILPNGLNAGFLTNSGAEAVENAIKLAFYNKPTAKYGVSFESGFHGRTLGALSATNSKSMHKKHLPTIPMIRVPFNETANEKLERLLEAESEADDIAFIIIEPVQGEGGYNVAPDKLVKDVKAFASDFKILLISDEVQCGMGRTGEWWGIQHYHVTPDIIVAAKALQVGATLANISLQVKPGTISSTWGGGHILDLACGRQIIKTIKKDDLLSNCSRMGTYLRKRLEELSENTPVVKNIRGLGLMAAFDLPDKNMRNNAVIQFLKNGLVTLGCGKNGIRLIPPYIVTEHEIDEAVEIIENSLILISKEKFSHVGDICTYLDCGAFVA